ncbi:MAG TPA: ABC transporter permease [Blastocatellia bacterium]|nr:ABC transporter permease [Blastocatellia bacterium]
MNSVMHDLRYAIRMMANNRAFTAMSVIVLALGIAANTLIFSVVNAVLIRSLPFPDADRIVMLFERDFKRHSREAIAPANFLDWRDQNQAFESMATYRPEHFSLTGADRPELVAGAVTTAGLFLVLGVEPILGRVFKADEENRGNGRVALISQSLWERRFGGDSSIVGQNIVANGEPLTIIGVMPAQFRFPFEESDLWIPPRQIVPEHVLRPNVNMASTRDSHYLDAVGRLKPGVSLAQAAADMDAVARHIEEQNPEDNGGRGVLLITLREDEVGDLRATLLLLFGAVGFVLLIACANVANLLLARATTRQKEIAIRTALGANRLRLVRQLLTESLLLAVLGGGLGLLLALWGINPLVSLMPAGIHGAQNIRLDGLVLGFTLAVSLATGVIFGLVPALHSTRSDLNETLKEGGRGGTAGARRNRARGLLVALEIALSMVLLIGAGLMIKSFVRLANVNPGFDTRSISTMRLSLPAAQYADPRSRATFFQQVIARLQSAPGVQSAAAISRLPLTPGNSSRSFYIEGRPEDGSGKSPSADYRVISSEYFSSMGTRLLKGRAFTERDDRNSHDVVIVNKTMAGRFWPDEDPLGKRFRIEADGAPMMEIVGVVEDVKHFGLAAQTRPEMYVPYQKDPWPFMTIVVRSTSDPKGLADLMRSEVWAVDRDLPVPDIKTIEQLLSNSVAQRRFNMSLLAVFGALALFLAAVGIYGVMSYSVTQRSHEIGIRMALGAQRSDVLRLVIGHAMTLTMIGAGLGLAAAFALTRLMTSLLFEVDATDPATFAGIAVVLTGVALAASFVPARRASKVDPMIALRCE